MVRLALERGGNVEQRKRNITVKRRTVLPGLYTDPHRKIKRPPNTQNLIINISYRWLRVKAWTWQQQQHIEVFVCVCACACVWIKSSSFWRSRHTGPQDPVSAGLRTAPLMSLPVLAVWGILAFVLELDSERERERLLLKMFLKAKLHLFKFSLWSFVCATVNDWQVFCVIYSKWLTLNLRAHTRASETIFSDSCSVIKRLLLNG